MRNSSVLYTIGTALARAHEAEVVVDLLVMGQWLRGVVSALDGHGVMLVGDHDELAVIRLEEVAAVKVLRGAAFFTNPEVETQAAHQANDLQDGARPMPAGHH